MKVLQQKTLYFSEGRSDKVYEVDLCESGEDLYVVNFRYGRRGASLRESTKTIFPVTYQEAVKLFNSLVLSKEKKGYTEAVTEVQAVLEEEPQIEKEVNVARDAILLKYLEDGIAGVYTRDWKLSRVILKAAHYRTTKAIPLIKHFITSKDAFEQYAAIYSLNQFQDTSERDKIYNVFNTLKFQDKVGRIAAIYCLKYGDDATKAKITLEASAHLPEVLQKEVNSPQAYFNALAIYILKAKGAEAAVLYYTYIMALSDTSLKPYLLDFIDKVPLKVNTFKSIRYIYRAAFAINDLDTAALVSKRIAVSPPGYTSNYLYVDNVWTEAYEEKKKANPSIAFSKSTKAYFNRSTYKIVYWLSQENKAAYIKFATALLISLNDATDGQKEVLEYHYNFNSDTRNYDTERRCFPQYHDFMAVMYIVHGNASRFQRQNNKWFFVQEDNGSPFNSREEPLETLWNAKPEEVLSILVQAKSDIAVLFALRILKDNPQFLEGIAIHKLEALIVHKHPKVLDVILDVVEKKYATAQPEPAIIIALLKSKHEKAHTLGLKWLKHYEALYFSKASFIEALLLTGNIEGVEYLKQLYLDVVAYKVPLDIEAINALFDTPSTFTFEYLVAVNTLIGATKFGVLLQRVSEEKIKELAISGTTNKLFAANLAKHSTISTYHLFETTIEGYITSEEAVLRKVGIELLLYFPDEFLLENHKQISAFCLSEHEEVRDAIQPTVEKLIALDARFKTRFFKALLTTIEAEETYAGVHDTCYTLLTHNYAAYLEESSPEQIFDLVLSQYEYAQKLGTPLFEKNIDLGRLPLKTTVKLAQSAIYDIRAQLRAYFEKEVQTISSALEDALLIFNSSWDDIIVWGCAYFEKHITPAYWTVELLLYACDHTKPEVQHFGRRLITQHFSDDKGLPLLLKLQEHPTKTMQFFVTNYLDNYAKDNVAVILKLELFFKTSLFAINANRATKSRIYKFLYEEAVKNKAVAEMTVRLVTSVLGTTTMRDRDHNIDVLLAIADVFPEIDLPVAIK